MIKAVLFDMDGLMFDTERLTSDIWISIGQKYGYPITMEMMNRMRGLPLQGYLNWGMTLIIGNIERFVNRKRTYISIRTVFRSKKD